MRNRLAASCTPLIGDEVHDPVAYPGREWVQDLQVPGTMLSQPSHPGQGLIGRTSGSHRASLGLKPFVYVPSPSSNLNLTRQALMTSLFFFLASSMDTCCSHARRVGVYARVWSVPKVDTAAPAHPFHSFSRVWPFAAAAEGRWVEFAARQGRRPQPVGPLLALGGAAGRARRDGDPAAMGGVAAPPGSRGWEKGSATAGGPSPTPSC